MEQSSWHTKFDWKAENYFDDPQVVQLCRAIEANDLEEMQTQIAAGADVNARGKGNMTPLLWAFPDNKIERFKMLLEHGADPNVIVESDFNTKQLGIRPGDSVTQLATESVFPDHFRYVMEYGGNPNLVNPKTGESLLVLVIRRGRGDAKDRVKTLIDKGVDVNQRNPSGIPVVMDAASYFSQFDLALFLIDAGANPKAYKDDSNMKLVHTLVTAKKGLHRLSQRQQADYAKLEQRLKDMGESFEEAEADLKHWRSEVDPKKAKKLRDAEIAARKAREAAEKEARESPE